jgi:Sec-independent protein secretion pathway components
MGPKDLPRVLRKSGKWRGSTKRNFRDIQNKAAKTDEDIEESSIEEKHSKKEKSNKKERSITRGILRKSSNRTKIKNHSLHERQVSNSDVGAHVCGKY